MTLGRITGKTSTLSFKFLVEGNAKKFQYVQVSHEGGLVLAQILELERDSNETVAYCGVIGKRYVNILQPLQTPLSPGDVVEQASDEFIKETLGLENQNGAYIGVLNGREKIKVYLDLNKILTRHTTILARTGSGKSYCTGVLLEEILDKGIPILILDPHGEYHTLKIPNKIAEEALSKFGVAPKGYYIQEYAPSTEGIPTAKELKLNSKNITTHELMHILPMKLSAAQQSVVYSALKNMAGSISFDQLIAALETEESIVKFSVINIIEYLQNLKLFSEAPTKLSELIQPGIASIVNLKGVSSDVQELIVYKLAKDLFDARKKEKIPPFFFVLEEAQNYCPERTFGESKSSKIIRQIASEGRKFGISMVIISQRPSRVEKNVISQASIQIILKMTNPHDLKAISNSVEGLTLETEKEIRNIPVGTAMVIGVADLPLFVDIRPRKSKHGGDSVSALIDNEHTEEIMEIEQYEGEILPVITPNVSLQDMKILHGSQPKTVLIPCLSILASQGGEDFPLLLNLTNHELVNDVDNASGQQLVIPKLQLSKNHQKVFELALKYGTFNPAELFSQSELQFSEVYDAVNNLSEKGIFIKNGDRYTISNNLKRFMNVKEFACYNKVDFMKVSYDQKLTGQISASEFINFLTKFVTVKNEVECWLVHHVCD
ncbi:MAG: DUF87 domain-containing protein [Nanoarchaeota archaeon]